MTGRSPLQLPDLRDRSRSMAPQPTPARPAGAENPLAQPFGGMPDAPRSRVSAAPGAGRQGELPAGSPARGTTLTLPSLRSASLSQEERPSLDAQETVGSGNADSATDMWKLGLVNQLMTDTSKEEVKKQLDSKYEKWECGPRLRDFKQMIKNFNDPKDNEKREERLLASETQTSAEFFLTEKKYLTNRKHWAGARYNENERSRKVVDLLVKQARTEDARPIDETSASFQQVFEQPGWNRNLLKRRRSLLRLMNSDAVWEKVQQQRPASAANGAEDSAVAADIDSRRRQMP